MCYGYFVRTIWLARYLLGDTNKALKRNMTKKKQIGFTFVSLMQARQARDRLVLDFIADGKDYGCSQERIERICRTEGDWEKDIDGFRDHIATHWNGSGIPGYWCYLNELKTAIQYIAIEERKLLPNATTFGEFEKKTARVFFRVKPSEKKTYEAAFGKRKVSNIGRKLLNNAVVLKQKNCKHRNTVWRRNELAKRDDKLCLDCGAVAMSITDLEKMAKK